MVRRRRDPAAIPDSAKRDRDLVPHSHMNEAPDLTPFARVDDPAHAQESVMPAD
jgi:hypothetical protein